MKTLYLLWRLLPLAITLALMGWGLFFWFQRSEARVVLAIKLVVTLLIMSAVLAVAATGTPWAIIVGLFGSVPLVIFWRPSLCGSIGELFGKIYTGGDDADEPTPLYSIAQARIKQGRYPEAIAEIQKQLAHFPNDFVGQIMLAEVQAEYLHDFDSATGVIEGFLSQEGHAPANIAFALNRLADWQLKWRHDPTAARQMLERIGILLPHTEQAQQASQRIAHLTTRAELLERQAPRPIPLAHADPRLGLRLDSSSLKPPSESPEDQALKCIEHLQKFPEDNEAREQLALLYARHYQRLDLALEQLEQLIAVPNQLAKHVVHWLNLIADLQIQLPGNLEAARAALQRIIDSYPKTAAADAARNRMAYLKLELKTKAPDRSVKLGKYKEGIGLNPPAKDI